MAPTPRPAVHRLAGFHRVAALATQHLLLAIVVDRLAVVENMHVMARALLAVGIFAGQWWQHRRPR